MRRLGGASENADGGGEVGRLSPPSEGCSLQIKLRDTAAHHLSRGAGVSHAPGPDQRCRSAAFEDPQANPR